MVQERPYVCWIVAASVKDKYLQPHPKATQTRTLFIDQKTFTVSRQKVEKSDSSPVGGTEHSTETMTVDSYEWDSALDASLFVFKAPEGAKQMADAVPTNAVRYPLVGTKAPEFRLKNSDGKEVTLAQFKGRPVLLAFWTTWCVPCVEEMPFFDLLSKAGSKDLAILLVDANEPKETALSYLKAKSYDVNAMFDDGGAVKSSYQVVGLPDTILIDREGQIVWRDLGMITRRLPDLWAKLHDLKSW